MSLISCWTTVSVVKQFLSGIIQFFAGHYQMCGANIQNWNNNYIKCERNGDKKKKLSLEEYLDVIKPLLQDIVNILKEKSDAWKIQLTIAINFMSSNDQSVMHSKSDNRDIMINAKEDKLSEEHFQSFFSRYQIGLDWKHQ